MPMSTPAYGHNKSLEIGGLSLSLLCSRPGGPADAAGAGQDQRGSERELRPPGALPVPDGVLAAHLQGVPLQQRGVRRAQHHRGQGAAGLPPAGLVAHDRRVQGQSQTSQSEAAFIALAFANKERAPAKLVHNN